MSGDLWAGAEVMAFRLISGLLSEKDVEISAIVLNNQRLATEIRRSDVPVEILDERKLSFFQIKRGLDTLLGKYQPHILHTHRLKENILGYLSSRSFNGKISLICTQHGLDEPGSSLKWRILSKLNSYVLSRHFTYVVAVSEEMRGELAENYDSSAKKLVVIHNGTNIGIPHCGRGRDHRFTIGSAGRFFPVKNYCFLVEVAAEVHRQIKDVRFVLAGEGPELPKILDKIQQYRLGETFLLKGFIEDISCFYNGLDVYINTSLHEGFPMSVLEAMAHGLPIIGPREGGIKEAVVEGENGFLVEGRSPTRYAEKCVELYRKRGLKEHMAKSSREMVESRFSTRTMSKKYLDLYHKTLSRRCHAE